MCPDSKIFLKCLLGLLVLVFVVVCLGDAFCQAARSPRRATIRVMRFGDAAVYIDAEFVGMHFDSTDNVVSVILDPDAVVSRFCLCEFCLWDMAPVQGEDQGLFFFDQK